MKDNLVLIGMPGVGKSTAGVVAAKLAGCQFLDTDLVIMQRDGRLLREIIEQDGVEGFLFTFSFSQHPVCERDREGLQKIFRIFAPDRSLPARS